MNRVYIDDQLLKLGNVLKTIVAISGQRIHSGV